MRRSFALVIAATVLGSGLTATQPAAAREPEAPPERVAETAVPPALEPMAVPKSGVGAYTPPATADAWRDDDGTPAPAGPREWFTATGRFVRNDNGSVTASFYNGPAFKKDGRGGWLRTKPSLAASTDRDWPLKADAGYRAVRFGRTADRLLSVDLPGGDVVLSAPGLAVGAPVARGGKPLYRDVATDTDLVFEPGAGGVKQLLVLDSARAPRSFRFHLADPGGVLGDAVPQADGGYRFANSVGDGMYLHLAPAIAYEQPAPGGDEPVGEPGSAHLSVTRVAGGFDVVESVDEEWLKGKSFPVVLDPTLQFKGSGHLDCYIVSDNYSDQGNCGAGALMTGNGPGGEPTGTCGTGSPAWCITRGLLKFDVAAMPKGSDVTAATLKMWQFKNLSGASFTMGLYNNNTPFTSSATWNQQNSTCTSTTSPPCWNGGSPGTHQANTSITAADGFRTWNMTGSNIVETWRNNLAAVGGLMTRANPESRSLIGTTGHTAGFYTNIVADSTKWPLLTVTYTPPAGPTVTKTVAAAPGYTTAPNGSYARGTVARFTVTTTSSVAQDDVTLRDTVPAGLTVLPETVTVDNVVCTTCLAGQVLTKTLLDYTAGQTHTLRYNALVTGTDERDCVNATNTAVTTPTGGGLTRSGSATIAICDSGLGLEPWWSYFSRPVAHGGTLHVNAANGNVVVQQQDSTPVQGRGRLAFGLRRTYNSQDTRAVELFGGIGENWQLGFGEVADSGISPSGLLVPPLPSLSKTLPITLVDRDGTRHVFAAKTPAPAAVQVMRLDSTLNPPALVPGTAVAGALTPKVLGAAVDLSKFNSVCVDVAYAAPAGVHLALWRYVALNNGGGAATCTQATGTATPVVLGFATERTDRYRNEFSWNGALLSQLDTAGNELRYAYSAGLPFAGLALGAVTAVYEPRECTLAQAVASGSTCRAFRIQRDPVWNTVTSIVDPAGRTTTYEYSTSFGFPQLTRVVNPDGTSTSYTYFDGDSATCTVTGQVPHRGQLCSITDERGSVTRIRYNTAVAGQFGRANSVVDRRGTTTTFSYAADGTSMDALVNGVQRRSWRLIDSRGRAGQLVDSQGTTTYHQTDFTWDSAGCRRPTSVTDNNLCRVVRTAFNDTQTGQPNGIDTANSDVSYTYTDEGRLLTQTRVLNATQTAVTTYGYRSLYVTAAGVVTAVDDTPSGSGGVTVGTRPAASSTVYVLSDRTQELPPRGNAPGEGNWALMLTRYRVENSTSAQPNTAPPAPPGTPEDAVICTQADLTVPVTNTGAVCQVETPRVSGRTEPSITRYTYDYSGAKRTMTSPKAVAETTSGTPPATTYTYYGSGTTDLSGLTSAAGWLKGVTDPAGGFVAFGYDRAGNVVKSWDRNATARGLALSSANTLDTYPANGVGGFARTLYGPHAGAPDQPAEAHPWRYVLETSDALGNRMTYEVDAHGNQTRARTPRGNLAHDADPNDTSYDTVQTFGPDGELLTRLTPNGAAAGGKTWRWRYDAYGNQISETDPLGHPDFPLLRADDPNGRTTTFAYDGVNRMTAKTWTRTGTAAQAAGGCTATGAAAPLSATRYFCSETYAYDGIDNRVATRDADAQTVRDRFDAGGRRVRRDTPRTPGVTTRTEWRYDRDDSVMRYCRPREFDSAEPNALLSCDATGGHYSTLTFKDFSGRHHMTFVNRDGVSMMSSKTFDADGNVRTETDARTNVTTHTYDLLGRRTRLDVPRDSGPAKTTTWTYDAVGNVTSVTRPGSRTTAFTYDAANRPRETVEGSSSVDALLAGPASADGGSNIRSSVRYDADGNVVATLEPRAFRDATGAPATTVPASTPFMTRYDVDKEGRVAAEYRPRYDSSTAFGDLAVTSQQTSQCTTANRPAAVLRLASDVALPAYTADAAVCVQRRTFDVAGNVARLTLPTSTGADNRYLEYSYTDDDLLSAVSAPSPADPNGSARVPAESTVYDGSGRPVAVSRAAPATGGTSYVSTRSYTSDGLLLQSTEGTSEHVADYTYDHNGNRKTVRDALLNVTSYAYFSDDLLKSVTDPKTKTTSYAYDSNGNTTDVTAPNLQGTGLTVHHTFTKDNLLETTTEPVRTSPVVEKRRTTYGYDDGGRKTSVTTDLVDGNGVLTETGGAQGFSYYPSDRPATETGRTGGTITRTYDAAGHVASVADAQPNQAAVSSAMTYYLDGLPRSVTQSGRTTRYAYDASGATVVRDVDDGSHAYTRYGYGNSGQLTSVTSDTLGAGQTIAFGYDAAGRPINRTDPNGTTITRTYRTDNLLETQRLAPTANPSSPIADWRYGYDALARVKLAARDASTSSTCPLQETSTLPDPGVQCMYYDEAGRLSGFRDPAGDRDVEYDANGNRITYGGSTFEYNLDNSILRATDAGGTKDYDYDAVGRLSTDGSTFHCYDGMDRLRQVRPGGTSCDGTLGNGVSYVYDGLDRQVTRTEVGASAVDPGTTTLHYDGTAQAVLTEAAPQNRTTTYVPAAGGPVFVTRSGGGGVSQYLADDGRGNISTATTTAGVAACSVRYDPFGSPIGAQSGSNACSTGSTPSSVLFGGARRDAVSGNYQLGSRTYDPGKAGFLTPDTYRSGAAEKNLSVGTDPLTANRYTYVNGDPVNLTDPTGHRPGCDEGDDCAALMRWWARKQAAVSSAPSEPEWMRILRDKGTDAAAADAYVRENMSPLPPCTPREAYDRNGQCGPSDREESAKYLRDEFAQRVTLLRLHGVLPPPKGFPYQPIVIETKAGKRAIDPYQDGCSAPLPGELKNRGVGHDFRAACATHDYGYDLWRYARDERKKGNFVAGDKEVADRGLRDDALADCDGRTWGWIECHAYTYTFEFFVKQLGTLAAADEEIVTSFPVPKPKPPLPPIPPGAQLPNPSPGPSPTPPGG